MLTIALEIQSDSAGLTLENCDIDSIQGRNLSAYPHIKIRSRSSTKRLGAGGMSRTDAHPRQSCHSTAPHSRNFPLRLHDRSMAVGNLVNCVLQMDRSEKESTCQAQLFCDYSNPDAETYFFLPLIVASICPQSRTGARTDGNGDQSVKRASTILTQRGVGICRHRLSVR